MEGTDDGRHAHVSNLASACRYDQLPASTVSAAKRQIIDTLACAWAGSNSAGIDSIRTLLTDRGGKAERYSWVFADQLPSPAAARLNGTMAAALDYDCLHDTAAAHPAIVVLPAALAMAERVGASGRDLICALVVGNEIILRLCGSMKTRPGWFYTSALGGFAAAAACANLLRLDEKMTTHAFGIALCYAAGTGQALIEKTLTKRLQSAIAAEAGVEAALMASSGITGPGQALEGPAGFFGLYSPADESAAQAYLGQKFLIEEVTYKKYSSCFFNHAAIEATLDIIKRNQLTVDDVANVKVYVSEAAAKFVGGDFRPGEAPQVAAQFSVKYSIAAALLHQRFGLREIDLDTILDPRVSGIARKIDVVADPTRGAFTPVDVEIRTIAGRVCASHIDTIPGTPERPLNEVELRAKVLDCFQRGARPLSAEEVSAFMDSAMRLDEATDVREIYSSLSTMFVGKAA